MAIYYYDDIGFVWSKQNGPNPLHESMMEAKGYTRLETEEVDFIEFPKVVDGKLVDDTEAATEALAEQFREERDGLLAEVDAIAGNALRWATLLVEQQTSWSEYRQALLDVPQQEGFPNTVVWPTKPN